MHRAIIGQEVCFECVVPAPAFTLLCPNSAFLTSWDNHHIYQHLRVSRDAAKSSIPLNGRLATMKASRENLIRLGRVEEAEKVR